MIEKLVNSKTRLKILKLFLSHIDDRYYLRELERLLEESLSPLRRQLLKLTTMGILITEVEANLKYYRLNKNFEGLDELKNIILGIDTVARSPEVVTKQSQEEIACLAARPLASLASNDNYKAVSTPKQFRYDLAILSFISVFVLITAIFVVYVNTKNMKQVVKLISNSSAELTNVRSDTPAGNGEMVSRKWKVVPGNVPVFSSGETREEKNSKEL